MNERIVWQANAIFRKKNEAGGISCTTKGIITEQKPGTNYWNQGTKTVSARMS